MASPNNRTYKVSSVNSPYVNILLNGTYSNGKQGINSFTMDMRQRPDYFISLDVKRTTSEAMNVDIKLTYVPSEDRPPNAIEEALWSCGGECFLTWGWGETGQLAFKVVKCMIYEYTVDFGNGVLTYNLTGISRAVSFTYSQVTLTLNPKDPNDAIKQIFTKSNLNKYYKFKYIGADTGGKPSDKFPDDIVLLDKGSRTGTPLQLLNGIAQRLKRNSKLSQFFLHVDDSVDAQYNSPGDSRGTIYIQEVYVDETFFYNTNTTNGKPLTFAWGSPDGEVLSWRPQYKGAFLLLASKEGKAITNPTSDNKTSEEPIFTNGSANVSADADTGKINVITSNNNGQSAITVDTNFFSTSTIRGVTNTFANDNVIEQQLGINAYEAQLTVLGNPKQETIGNSVILVLPLLGSTPHHSWGYYLIKGIQESISSQGYTTTYSLCRLSYGYDAKTGQRLYNQTSLGKYTQEQDTEPLYINGQKYNSVKDYLEKFETNN